MHLLLMVALLVGSAGESNGVRQQLTCPYHEEHRTLPRVWCKQHSKIPECCNGFVFDYQSTNVSPVEISEDEGSFTVSVSKLPSSSGGVHWCGVRVNGTILIKLAERYFYSSTSVYIWSIARWVVLPAILALTCLAEDIILKP
ncbi:hypothetical protein CRUP_013565 [Coryphaenoides rupestris]|nr:hypothetical protein CRUP_013565 [Coryphaenoides rupestris]